MDGARFVPLLTRFSGPWSNGNDAHSDTVADPGPQSRAEGQPQRWAVPEVLATRIATVGLWAMVITGALAGFVALAGASGVSPPPVTEANESSVGAEGFAELYVAAWLDAGEGQEDGVRALYPDAPALRDVDAGSMYAARTATVAAEDLGGGYWSITVAAEVLVAVVDEAASSQDEPGAAGYRRHGTHYYRVGVLAIEDRHVATSLPGEVPAPALAEMPKLAGLGLERPRPDDPIATAVRQFLAAYLTGEGEIERYVTPGAPIQAVQPAPFAGAEVSRLALAAPTDPGALTVVRVETAATTAAGAPQILHYALELSERQGRWEVRQVLPAAPLQAAPTHNPSTEPKEVPQ